MKMSVIHMWFWKYTISDFVYWFNLRIVLPQLCESKMGPAAQNLIFHTVFSPKRNQSSLEDRNSVLKH